MFYLADIPSWGPNAFKFYSFYTNALANLISENLVIDFASSLGMEILKQKDQNLFRILFYKSENAFEPLKTSFNKDLVFSNKVNLFKKITDLLKNIDDAALLDVHKTLLDKLLALDNKSVTSLVFQGDYYYLAGDSKTALDFYKKAAMRGNTNAIYTLSLIYGNEEDGDYDFDKYIYYLKKTAKAGLSMAHAELALMYSKKNKKLFSKHYKEAMKQDKKIIDKLELTSSARDGLISTIEKYREVLRRIYKGKK
jgi:hypothetical protein